MSENKGLLITFKGIKELGFSSDLRENIIKEFDESLIDFNLGFSINPDKDSEIINILLDVVYEYRLNGKYIKFLEFKSETIFKFENSEFNEEIIIGEDSVKLSDPLFLYLMNITVGATRGMMAYKVSALPIDIVLPIIDLTSLLDAKNEEESKETSKKSKNKNKK